jgi:hypothetical protein|uniref:Uncharacterized protein n=1 Tax=Podoviridae sp. ctz6O13 TaxID=2827757 RepID=A0A8S5TKC0_9CAUD|nr:MAG TPA: hypothetical protein [Podoviridae sp. ctz6O13]
MTKEKKNLESYIWKGPNVNGVQQERKLMDCDLLELQKYYDHCRQMLYNDSMKQPGRYTLIKMVESQIQHCRAELLVRWLRAEKSYTYQHCYEDIQALIHKNKETLTQSVVETYPISALMSEIPNEFKRVPIGLVLKASMYSLGICDTAHITLNFIVKMGLYLTQKEMQQELFERDPETGKARNRLEVIKQREQLNPSIRLEVKPDGLTYAEFKQMYRLRKDKYENFTSAQLKLLSEKVLYRFQLRCEAQARQWEEKIAEIEEVAESKGWDIHRQIS